MKRKKENIISNIVAIVLMAVTSSFLYMKVYKGMLVPWIDMVFPPNGKGRIYWNMVVVYLAFLPIFVLVGYITSSVAIAMGGIGTMRPLGAMVFNAFLLLYFLLLWEAANIVGLWIQKDRHNRNWVLKVAPVVGTVILIALIIGTLYVINICLGWRPVF